MIGPARVLALKPPDDVQIQRFETAIDMMMLARGPSGARLLFHFGDHYSKGHPVVKALETRYKSIGWKVDYHETPLDLTMEFSQ